MLQKIVNNKKGKKKCNEKLLMTSFSFIHLKRRRKSFKIMKNIKWNKNIIAFITTKEVFTNENQSIWKHTEKILMEKFSLFLHHIIKNPFNNSFNSRRECYNRILVDSHEERGWESWEAFEVSKVVKKTVWIKLPSQ